MIGFPYTNFHRLNLDALIKIVEDVKKIPTKTSQLINDSGFINIAQAITAAPVQSVNGKTGVVSLNATDVGAKPSSYEAPVQSVNGETGDVEISIPEASTNNPVMDGTVAIGTSVQYARADHRHPKDTSKANLSSPTFTGMPKAPTAAIGTNTTQIATTAYVQNALKSRSLSPTGSGASSGVTVLQVYAFESDAVVEVSFAITLTTAKTNGAQLFKISGLPTPAMGNIWLLGVSHSTGSTNPAYTEISGDDIIIRQGGTSPTGQWYVYHFTYMKEG